jgi:hypothetical protein
MWIAWLSGRTICKREIDSFQLPLYETPNLKTSNSGFSENLSLTKKMKPRRVQEKFIFFIGVMLFSRIIYNCVVRSITVYSLSIHVFY